MKLKELQNLSGGAKVDYLLANKSEILAEKKGMLKRADGVPYVPTKDVVPKSGNENKGYTVVANSCGFIDSHLDVSMPGSFDKTVAERGDKWPILVNHSTDPRDIFAKNLGASLKSIPVGHLGYPGQGETQCLCVNLDPVYDAKMATLYANGEIKEHSIAIRYVQIKLAANTALDRNAFDLWNASIGQVFNREIAEENGFFFQVIEQKVFEVSAVLFGSNSYTPIFTQASEPQKALVWEPIRWSEIFPTLK